MRAMTETNRKVLAAINQYFREGDKHRLDVGAKGSEPLPAVLADLGLQEGDVYLALEDLYELGYIDGITAAQASHPVVITKVTATGRQVLG
jgi:hypothetical protein